MREDALLYWLKKGGLQAQLVIGDFESSSIALHMRHQLQGSARQQLDAVSAAQGL